MSQSRFKSCFLSDLATAAGVDTRTFGDWLTESDQIKMIRLGHHITDRKLKPKVVEFLVTKFLPEMIRKDFVETG
ncbi:hypothetical protein BWI97_14305 [Siphonobacter sp. BAB-5405]|uniref:hypothetical protein n=1 Tax=Siphonobacter sp. BAB-5405 TaxID=1864825 RepID=UPI000C80FA5C|nr:hypothetical protein [Siphonobacter sp. BAB-5405]PMD95524.1 hypothetical protein BWI97_14305 [Siphonobacter sp. BAB-5405]